MLNKNLYLKIGNKQIRLFDFTWVLFLGVLPFDKAALTLYYYDKVGEIISIILNAITIVCAVVCLVNLRTRLGKKLAQKYVLFFIILILTYLFAIFVDQIVVTRFFSLVCLLGYCLFAISYYGNVDKLIGDMNKALLFIIILSFFLYIGNNDNVMYTENALKIVFKGIAANRNSYSEISLLYIATNYYIWKKEKKALLWRLCTTIVAVYTTFLTNGATSILCVCMLLLLFNEE